MFKIVQSEAVQKVVIHAKVICRSISLMAFFSLQADSVGVGDWAGQTFARNILWATAIYHAIFLSIYLLSIFLLYTTGDELSKAQGDDAKRMEPMPETAVPPHSITMNRQAYQSLTKRSHQ